MQNRKATGYVKKGLVVFGRLYLTVLATLWLVTTRNAISGCNPPDAEECVMPTVSITGPVSACISDPVNFTADISTGSGICTDYSILWYGDTGSASSLSGTTLTTSYDSPGEKTVSVTLTVEGDGDCTATASHTFNIVKVDSVTHSMPDCFDGHQITFTAVPAPLGGSFPSGSPVWSATAGTFVGGNTGPSVVWQAPDGSGGYATITATCGASSVDDTVAYVYLPPPPSSALRRMHSTSWSPTVEPAGYPVTLSEDSSSPELGVTIASMAVGVDNLINTWDVNAHLNSAFVGVEAVLSSFDVKVFVWTIPLEKWFRDWYMNVEAVTGELLYDGLKSLAKNQVGSQIEADALLQGFNSVLAADIRADAEAEMGDYFNDHNPFPGTITDSAIPEGTTYSWSAVTTVATSVGNITIEPTGYPGWPDVSPMSPSEFIAHINADGFDWGDVTITGIGQTLNASAAGANWEVNGSISAGYGDVFGEYSVLGSVSIVITFY